MLGSGSAGGTPGEDETAEFTDSDDGAGAGGGGGGSEDGMDSGVVVGAPVIGGPITEPDESNITVTGMMITAVSEPGAISEDEDKLESGGTTGDSCLEVSTLDVNWLWDSDEVGAASVDGGAMLVVLGKLLICLLIS